MAVHRGTLERLPCEVCGALNSQGHHADYSKALEVRWLCPQHHADVHRVQCVGFDTKKERA